LDRRLIVLRWAIQSINLRPDFGERVASPGSLIHAVFLRHVLHPGPFHVERPALVNSPEERPL